MNFVVTGSFKIKTPNILPNKASELKIMAVWVEEVYFWAMVWIKNASIELSIAKYKIGIIAPDSIDIFLPSNIKAQNKDNMAATANCKTDIT